MDFDALRQAIIEGEEEKALALVHGALAEGCTPLELFEKALSPGMAVVGQKMQAGEYFIPEVLFSARAMQACAELLRPHIVGGAGPSKGTVVACTVQGDLHDIGRHLVCMMLEGAGFRVVDLGHDCPPQKVVEVVEREGAEVVALSALITTTMLNMAGVIEALSKAGLRSRVKVMVGGAPLNARFAREIGADDYGEDAARAAELAKSYLAAIRAA